MERLSKFISRCGIASRRKSEEIILSGMVKVNNDIVLEPHYSVDYTKDIVTIDIM
jgi:23S rRNA pseudouridine2605 synthase